VLGRKNRSEVIGVFLALLELIREKKILVTQSDSEFADAEIVEAPEEHQKTFVGASLHLSAESEPAEEEPPEPNS
jgi:chromatin segregation and condensation protein Rec8/ScpA/Scc1 (kleisin family)